MHVDATGIVSKTATFEVDRRLPRTRSLGPAIWLSGISRSAENRSSTDRVSTWTDRTKTPERRVYVER